MQKGRPSKAKRPALQKGHLTLTCNIPNPLLSTLDMSGSGRPHTL